MKKSLLCMIMILSILAISTGCTDSTDGPSYSVASDSVVNSSIGSTDVKTNVPATEEPAPTPEDPTPTPDEQAFDGIITVTDKETGKNITLGDRKNSVRDTFGGNITLGEESDTILSGSSNVMVSYNHDGLAVAISTIGTECGFSIYGGITLGSSITKIDSVFYDIDWDSGVAELYFDKNYKECVQANALYSLLLMLGEDNTLFSFSIQYVGNDSQLKATSETTDYEDAAKELVDWVVNDDKVNTVSTGYLYSDFGTMLKVEVQFSENCEETAFADLVEQYTESVKITCADHGVLCYSLTLKLPVDVQSYGSKYLTWVAEWNRSGTPSEECIDIGKVTDGRIFASVDGVYVHNVAEAFQSEEYHAAQEAASVSAEAKSAVQKAKDYLRVMAFSYSGLVDQLEYEGYSYEDAVYGVDNCGADWNEQAVKKAKSYLDIMSFSRDGLISQLEYDGFTHDQAVYGAEQNGY